MLSVIYPHVYFPTYSNGLKEIARYLGFDWTEPDAPGMQSIVWRRRWEETNSTCVKGKADDLQPGGLCRAEAGDRLPPRCLP